MLNKSKVLRRVTFVVVMLGGAFAAVLQADVPRVWFLAGSKPDEFVCGVDPGETYQSYASAFLKSKSLNVDGFGALMQRFAAEQYKTLWDGRHYGCVLIGAKTQLRLTICRIGPSRGNRHFGKGH